MKQHVTLALMGFGTVGSGTLELLNQHRKDVEARVGAPVRVKWVISRSSKRAPILNGHIQQSRDWRDPIADPEVDCVVELIGGTEPARDIVLAALKAGKHVVTANKALLSKHWDEIFTTARSRSRLVYFEAAVGGGVPVVQALNEGLAGNRIHKIQGILNGTTNYILTRMQESGMEFREALKAAQKAGFAEANPSFDLDGIDAAQKVAILGSLATGQWVAPERVYTEGISGIHLLDVRLVEERLHSRIKLLGIAERTSLGWVFRVHPTIIPQSHPFANVRNEYNAISLTGNAVGDVMLYGKGAGRLPTSSAVLSDVIFLSRQIANGTAGRLPYVSARTHDELKVASMESLRRRYYLRVSTMDRPGTLSRITGVLGRHNVSISSVHQDSVDRRASRRGVPIFLVTHAASESQVQQSVKVINRFSGTIGQCVLIRME